MSTESQIKPETTAVPPSLPIPAPTNNSSSNAEDVVAKYKRLLSLARSSLEANQAALINKDQQIAELMAVIEEERSKKVNRSQKDYDDANQNFPRRILCRVDVNDSIWVLLEYETHDEWKSFNDEDSLGDYIKRIPGPPLYCPQKCLSTEESSRLVEECKKKTEKIIEEFRRYKVRMEINLKQSLESKSSLLGSTTLSGSGTTNSYTATAMNKPTSFTATGTLSSHLERALSQGNMLDSNQAIDEFQRLKTQLQEQETKWRHAYEKLAKENEAMKTKGAESVIASQWRQRYENCFRDKEDLAQKLSLYTQLSEAIAGDDRTMEQMYMELQEEFKGLRKRLHQLMHEYMSKESAGPNEMEEFLQEMGRILQFYRIDHLDLDDHKLLVPMEPLTPRSAAAITSIQNGGGDHHTGSKGMAESKVQYVRQMIFQYLVCREPEVKQHIESALMTLFRFTEEEKKAIQLKELEENEDTFSSITSFLGSFTS